MAGLILRNPANGQEILNMTGNYSQGLGSVVTGGVNGSAAISSPPAGKTLFYVVLPLVDLQREKGKRPGVTISGNTLSWTYSYNTNGWGYFSANCRIFYGYY
ncbi:hypothetical protein IFT80_02560 [Pseudomonas sp. CFBP 8771]|uniref:hypothetical protein n=1 Tax=Pseudomonas sp. CFBP 8771 TaxID=2775285 RepID=UPI00177FF03D|nr:hypothetical protein [Pseudomonas sp. CFBP 8771]MBD8601519.1 hypothetical protein [Pseudomonas sp. CFBP 8771]